MWMDGAGGRRRGMVLEAGGLVVNLYLVFCVWTLYASVFIKAGSSSCVTKSYNVVNYFATFFKYA